MSFGVKEEQKDWKDVNWSWSNREIARFMQCSMESVYRARRKIRQGLPLQPFHRQGSTLLVSEQLNNIDWTLDTKTLGKILHISKEYAYALKRKWYKKQGLPYEKKNYGVLRKKADKIDWYRSDKEIGAEYNLSPYTVRYARGQLNIPSYAVLKRSKDKSAHCVITLSKRKNYTAFCKLVEALKKAPLGTTPSDVIVGLIEQHL